MKEKMRILTTLLLAAAVAALAACGGGGGGGGGSTIPYSGVTDQAVIDNQNAGEIAMGAYENATSADSMNVLSLTPISSGDRANISHSMALAETLKEAFLTASDSTSATASNIRAQTSEPMYGCDGVGYMTITANSQTSGTINFVQYKEGCYSDFPVTIDGSVSFKATLDSNQEIQSFTLTYNALTTTTGGETFTFSGSMGFTYGTTAETFTLTMVLRDEGTGKTFKIENYEVSYEYSSGTIQMSGKFFNPDYGYVTLSTPTPLVTLYTYYWPSSGVLRCDGANNTWVEITFSSSPELATGEADTNGDGVADFFFTYDPNAAPGSEITPL